MALSGLYSNLNILLRWLHVIAAITWIGHLYFLNLVNVPLQTAIDAEAKSAVNPQLLPRVLWWFRWAAMFTLLAGLLLFTMNYMYAPGAGFGPTPLFIDKEGITSRATWIMFGMLLAFIMWFNVWMVIWPAQKKMLRGQATADQAPLLRRRAFRASRTNLYLSGPMLFGMLAPSHYGSVNFVTWIVAVVIGLAVMWLAMRASFLIGGQ